MVSCRVRLHVLGSSPTSQSGLQAVIEDFRHPTKSNRLLFRILRDVRPRVLAADTVVYFAYEAASSRTPPMTEAMVTPVAPDYMTVCLTTPALQVCSLKQMINLMDTPTFESTGYQGHVPPDRQSP